MRSAEEVNQEYAALCTEFGDLSQKIRFMEKRLAEIDIRCADLNSENESIKKNFEKVTEVISET